MEPMPNRAGIGYRWTYIRSVFRNKDDSKWSVDLKLTEGWRILVLLYPRVNVLFT